MLIKRFLKIRQIQAKPLIGQPLLYELDKESLIKRKQVAISNKTSEKAANKIAGIFFPRDFPQSVTANYTKFAAWSFAGSVCGTVSGILSTQALLAALGMGSSSAVGVAAGLNWVIKDGLGLLGGVIYTSMASGRFDAEPKVYRFRAALLLQISTLCELMTPLVPGAFLLLASVSNIGKNIAWLALSGTRAQMNQSFCTRDNLGDVTAKSGSQATAAALCGTGIGVGLSAYLGTAFSTMMALYIPLGLINMFCVYKSNFIVKTKSLNVQRAELLIKAWLNEQKAKSPSQIANIETFVQPYRSVFDGSVLINSPLTKLQVQNLTTISHDLETDGYHLQQYGKKFNLWYYQKATPHQTLKGFYTVCCLRAQQPAPTDEQVRKFTSLLQLQGWNLTDLMLDDEARLQMEK